MNNRRKFLAAGGALAALSALPKAQAGSQSEGKSLYIHGMVWNRQLPSPMNDWLIRLDAKVDLPNGNQINPRSRALLPSATTSTMASVRMSGSTPPHLTAITSLSPASSPNRKHRAWSARQCGSKAKCKAPQWKASLYPSEAPSSKAPA